MYPSAEVSLAMKALTCSGWFRSVCLARNSNALLVKFIVYLLLAFFSISMSTFSIGGWVTVDKAWRVGHNPSLALVIFHFVAFVFGYFLRPSVFTFVTYID